jgi:hypothetical protein
VRLISLCRISNAQRCWTSLACLLALRPDESLRLELRGIKVVKDESTGERILEIEVRDKRGVGFCKSMPGAILPFERVRKRKNLRPTDKTFGKSPRELMNTVLDELNLKFDRDGHIHTCYSLRHTYICLRLLEGADIYQVVKNCRTSVEMIEKYYVRHWKSNIDVSAVNVHKVRPAPDAARKKASKSMKERHSLHLALHILIAPLIGEPQRGCGETGRRAGFKIPFRKECRFEPDHPHQP